MKVVLISELLYWISLYCPGVAFIAPWIYTKLINRDINVQLLSPILQLQSLKGTIKTPCGNKTADQESIVISEVYLHLKAGKQRQKIMLHMFTATLSLL